MIHLILLAFGVCCALLCHWIIRNTHLRDSHEWSFDEHKYVSTYNKKLSFPRWAYILMWLFCVVLYPIAFVFPLCLIIYVIMLCSDDDAKFGHFNKFFNWLTKKV